MFMVNRFSLFALLTMFAISGTFAKAQTPPVVPEGFLATWVCTVYGHCGDPDASLTVRSYPKGSRDAALQNAMDRARTECANFIKTGETCVQTLLALKTTKMGTIGEEPVFWDVRVVGITCNGRKRTALGYGLTFCDAYRMGRLDVYNDAIKHCEKVRCYCWQVISKPCCCNK